MRNIMLLHEINSWVQFFYLKQNQTFKSSSIDLISAAWTAISAAECLYWSIFSRAAFLASNNSISDWRFAYQIHQTCDKVTLYFENNETLLLNLTCGLLKLFEISCPRLILALLNYACFHQLWNLLNLVLYPTEFTS